MPLDLAKVRIFHITAISNLPAIIGSGSLLSDALLGGVDHEVIGYDTIKQRRLMVHRVDCCGDRFVGEFVPFYYCPRSPMLFVVNNGRTGKPAGCQKDIVHLVSTVDAAIGVGHAWAVSDGNAAASHTCFSNNPDAVDALDWDAIKATSWQGRQHEKQAEFLVADTFPWTAIHEIGCHSEAAAEQVRDLLKHQIHAPLVKRQPGWYY